MMQCTKTGPWPDPAALTAGRPMLCQSSSVKTVKVQRSHCSSCYRSTCIASACCCCCSATAAPVLKAASSAAPAATVVADAGPAVGWLSCPAAATCRQKSRAPSPAELCDGPVLKRTCNDCLLHAPAGHYMLLHCPYAGCTDATGLMV